VLAVHLSAGGVRPQAVLVSPAARTQETFERIREALPGNFEHWTEERLYGAGVEELIGIVAELPSGLTEVMLIGHNPGLGALAGELAGPGPDADRLRHKFPTGALATLDANSEWSRLRPTTTSLRSFVRPKDLGSD
jgi:phosphohistidine phosphatase